MPSPTLRAVAVGCTLATLLGAAALLAAPPDDADERRSLALKHFVNRHMKRTLGPNSDLSPEEHAEARDAARKEVLVRRRANRLRAIDQELAAANIRVQGLVRGLVKVREAVAWRVGGGGGGGVRPEAPW